MGVEVKLPLGKSVFLGLIAGLGLWGVASALSSALEIPQSAGVLVSKAEAAEPKKSSIATAVNPAVLSVHWGKGPVDPAQSVIELTIRALDVKADESYLVNVYAYHEGDQVDLAQDRWASAHRVGSFSFFQPPADGEVRSFFVGTPQKSAGDQRNIKLIVEVYPASPILSLNTAKVEILDAKIIR